MPTGDGARTPQEEFWASGFGDAYTERNQGSDLFASKLALFAEVLRNTEGLSSVLEIGANRGLNLAAIKTLLPDVPLTGVEINAAAAKLLAQQGFNAVHGSILEVSLPPRSHDLVFTMGVLIHIEPGRLPQVYKAMAEGSSKYVLIAEYYNPVPVTVTYRGVEDRLFKRDFAGEFLDAHPDFELIDYGFRYHRGVFPLDDLTWFLMHRVR